MTMKTIIVEAIKRKTCVEHKPQIKIKHITNVIIDDANKHNDIYLNIQRSLKKEKMLLLFFCCQKKWVTLTMYPTSARLYARLLYRLSKIVHKAKPNSVKPRTQRIIMHNLLKIRNDDFFMTLSSRRADAFILFLKRKIYKNIWYYIDFDLKLKTIFNSKTKKARIYYILSEENKY